MVTDLPLATDESASGRTPVPSPDANGDLSIPNRGSDPEKLKVDEAGESEVDGEEEYDEVRDYFDKLMETDGFADLDRPKGLVCCGVISALPDRLYKVQECIDFVLKEHNKKPEWGMKLEFSEILWANCSPCSGANYYITFKAADLKSFSKKEKVYEARVYRRWDGTKKTDIFRQKAPSKRVFVKPDRKERLW